MKLSFIIYADVLYPLLDFLDEEFLTYSYWRRWDEMISVTVNLNKESGNVAARGFDIGYKISELERKKRV